MGLLQQAEKTYDAMDRIGLVGEYEEGKEPLAPIGHIITTINIIITIDTNGKFVSAERLDKKLIIPVTEQSAGRSGKNPKAHPLADKVVYLSGHDENKYKMYHDELQEWQSSDYGCEPLNAILKYIEGGTLTSDLSSCGLIKFENGNIVSGGDDFVSWIVLGSGDSLPVYEDKALMLKYSEYYLDKKTKEAKSICFVTGNEDSVAVQHLKGVVPINGNAKIVSSNDSVNFTYRGRFNKPEDALTIGYRASQKAHNALKWIVANQKVTLGNRVFICWNPEGKVIPSIQSPLLKRSVEKRITPSDYKRELTLLLNGYKEKMSETDDVIIASFDAANTGRLSIAYYNELKESDFLERLAKWDTTCCWYHYKYGVFSPSLYDIVECAYGYQRGNEETAKLETDSKMISQHMQRIIGCRVDGMLIPRDLVKCITSKANNLQILNKANREKLLFTACAVIKKQINDYEKEDVEMALEPEKQDRSYQYGRLLAVFEKIEKDTYEKDENRETNAIRLQSTFVKRPAYASKIIIEQLKNSYYPKLKPGTRTIYDKLIGQIMEIISEFGDMDYNKPLSDTYLLGYYLQKNELYKKRTNKEEDMKNE